MLLFFEIQAVFKTTNSPNTAHAVSAAVVPWDWVSVHQGSFNTHSSGLLSNQITAPSLNTHLFGLCLNWDMRSTKMHWAYVHRFFFLFFLPQLATVPVFELASLNIQHILWLIDWYWQAKCFAETDPEMSDLIYRPGTIEKKNSRWKSWL